MSEGKQALVQHERLPSPPSPITTRTTCSRSPSAVATGGTPSPCTGRAGDLHQNRRKDNGMLMRFDPFRELDRVTQMVAQRVTPREIPMAMDAYRDGDRFIVHFDIPGIDPSAVDLTVEKNVITVRAERRWEPREAQEVVVAERPQGQFTRQLFLGDSLDPERVEAKYENGVLTLVIPVAEQAKPRKVEVSGGGGQTQSGQPDGASNGDEAGTPVTADAGAGAA
jgi:HSP20 family protein